MRKRRIGNITGLAETIVTDVKPTNCGTNTNCAKGDDGCCADELSQANPISLTVNVNSNNNDSVQAPFEQPVFQPFVANPFMVQPQVMQPTMINPQILQPQVMQPIITDMPQYIYPQQVVYSEDGGGSIIRDGMRAKRKAPCKEVFYREFI